MYNVSACCWRLQIHMEMVVLPMLLARL
eukprot:SAG25_NODE_11824_length_294_cov_0.794872_1_plen_27_part_10